MSIAVLLSAACCSQQPAAVPDRLCFAWSGACPSPSPKSALADCPPLLLLTVRFLAGRCRDAGARGRPKPAEMALTRRDPVRLRR